MLQLYKLRATLEKREEEANSYLVILIGWSRLNIAAGYIHLLAIIIEVHTGHSVHYGTYHTHLAGTLALLNNFD